MLLVSYSNDYTSDKYLYYIKAIMDFIWCKLTYVLVTYKINLINCD